ncbi:MAG: SIMPL domain-containing protein [Deltaproteobacteria bacterium]|nr:SIMPL domain-containing protein [Deltaproteobacteria bacterium]
MSVILARYSIMSIMLWIGLTGFGQAGEPPAIATPSISVEAEGKVMAIPDQALLTVEVETRASQADAATKENAGRSDALLKALKQALGPDDQVKTLGFRLNPVYAAKNRTNPPEVKGYEALHRFQVRVKGPERLGAIIDLALKNGASGVNGPFWEHSRLEELQRAAAVAALEKARKMAEALAQAQGLKITGVEKISTGILFRPLRGAAEGKAFTAAPTTPIEVGEEEIRASVQAVFQVQPSKQ